LDAVPSRPAIEFETISIKRLLSQPGKWVRTIDQLFLFKADNFQHTGSFKFRGAMRKLSAQSDDTRLITASSGNHGIAAARAAKTLSKKVIVVLPETVVQVKLEKVQAYGVDVILHDVETGLAEKHAQHLAASQAIRTSRRTTTSTS
jgi:threonine dehydratase